MSAEFIVFLFLFFGRLKKKQRRKDKKEAGKDATAKTSPTVKDTVSQSNVSSGEDNEEPHFVIGGR